jgi:hypothetical protein
MNAKSIATGLQSDFTKYFNSAKAAFRPKPSDVLDRFTFEIGDLERYQASLFGDLFVRELRDGKHAANVVACLMVVPSNYSSIRTNMQDQASFLQAF